MDFNMYNPEGGGGTEACEFLAISIWPRKSINLSLIQYFSVRGHRCGRAFQSVPDVSH